MEMEIEETTELQKTEKKDVAPVGLDDTIDNLISLAVQKDFDVDRLSKLIELKNSEEDRFCKREYEKHFAEMQAEFEPIARTVDGSFGKYAPLPQMVKKYGPIIAKHGISYKWTEERGEGKDKIVRLHKSGYGHTDSETSFVIPEGSSVGGKNEIQKSGEQTTYGKRYTFKSGFGITEIGEDHDGTFEDAIQYANQIKALRDCKTKDALETMWKDIRKDMQSNRDNHGLEILKAECHKCVEVFNAKAK